MFEIVDPLIRGVAEFSQDGFTIGVFISIVGFFIALVLFPFGGQDAVISSSRDIGVQAKIQYAIQYSKFGMVSFFAAALTWLFCIVANISLMLFSDFDLKNYAIFNGVLLFSYPLFIHPLSLKVFGSLRPEEHRQALKETFEKLTDDWERRSFLETISDSSWEKIAEIYGL